MALLKNIAQLFFDSAIEIRQNIMGLKAGAVSNGSDAEMLNLYVREWTRYCVAFKSINGVCRYLNKCLKSNYETAQYPASPTDVDSSSTGLHFQPVIIQLGQGRSERVELKVRGIEDVAKSVWNSLILRYFKEKENDVLIKNFLIALRTEESNQADLKAFIDSYRWCDDMSLLAMLEADTKDYYANASQEFINNNDTSAYVLFATEQLSKESVRTNYLWSSNTAAISIIMRMCEMELIENHKNELQQEFEKMLQSERTEDVNILFKLLGKNEGTMLALQKSLNQLVLKEFDNSYNPSQPSQEILSNVLGVYQKHVKFIESAFDNDKNMMGTLEDAIAQIINQKIKKSWSLFSNFVDEILKKHLPITKEISGIMKLFTIRTESFDTFISDFKEKLAERSIFGVLDLGAEECVLELLNEKLSPEQNCHLKRILQDYKENRESVFVLTSHAWPSSCNPKALNESIPESLKVLMENFENEYREAHCGRKLQWCPQLITLQTENDTIMTLLQYQLIKYLPFNSGNATEITQRLDVSLNEFTASLKALQEAEIIRYDSDNGTFEFVSLPGNLNLIPIKGVSEEQDSSVLAQIVGEGGKVSMEIDSSKQVRQSFILQSLISIILKRQRQASPAELKKLLTASAAALNYDHAFVPTVEEIDAAVNSLIGKGYLEFNEIENLFIYVP